MTQGYLVLIWNQCDTRIDWVQAWLIVLPPWKAIRRAIRAYLREVFAQQTLFQPDAETTMTQQQHGSVEQVVFKGGCFLMSFIAAMPEQQQAQLNNNLNRSSSNIQPKAQRNDLFSLCHPYLCVQEK